MKGARSVYKGLQRRLFSCAFFICVVVRSSAEGPTAVELGFQSPSQLNAVLRASSVLGNSEQTSLSLIRELQNWRSRALDAEGRLVGSQPTKGRPAEKSPQASVTGLNVIGSLDAERVVLVSCGKDSGVFEGALISIGAGVMAKVVESRSGVSAAVVENAFQGKVSVLDGQPAQLVLVR